MAARIRARAMRRAGELLKQIEPGKTGPKQLTDAADTQLSRTDVAKRAGMSERQQVTAVRVASIPERQFTEQVESATPPTLTELARQGCAASQWWYWARGSETGFPATAHGGPAEARGRP